MPSEGSSHPLEGSLFLQSPWQPFSMPITNSFVWSYPLPRLALWTWVGQSSYRGPLAHCLLPNNLLPDL